tara:strand:+ start:6389 stop:6616 length:228 start_codon:yes stop_codon:yes gene_type:complete
MTLQRIELDGHQHLILHYKFAINNPNSKIYIKGNHFLADINGVVYVLGWLDSEDSKADSIRQRLQLRIRRVNKDE